jgi:uncharacterized membrane protein YkvA (DUF1232 family)
MPPADLIFGFFIGIGFVGLVFVTIMGIKGIIEDRKLKKEEEQESRDRVLLHKFRDVIRWELEIHTREVDNRKAKDNPEKECP